MSTTKRIVSHAVWLSPFIGIHYSKLAQAEAPERANEATERMKTLGNLPGRLWFPLNISALMRARDLPVGEPKEVIAPATQQ
ncbi:MAG: hypothetical protein L0Z50_02820, partial [Verrucomicrobiales bacterium]|nr:hypothetical protein [Verrucomicrobiales bacterium]